MTLPVSIFSPAQLAYLLGIAAVLGACLGSFFNCLAWRMVHGESALHGRSHCAQCGHALSVFDLIPIVSWIALRGKCRYCGKQVSPRYVTVELFMALVFVALFVRYGFGIQAVVYAALCCILLGLSLVDLDSFIIPNGFIVAGCLLWLLSIFFMPAPSPTHFSLGSLFVGLVGYSQVAVLLDGLAGFLLFGVFVLCVSLLMDKLTGRQSLGGGDIKLLAMLGLFLGVAGSFVNLLLACIFGLVFALAQQMRAKRTEQTVELPSADDKENDQPTQRESFRMKTIPFGPSIALAACVTLLFGWQVLACYLSLF